MKKLFFIQLVILSLGLSGCTGVPRLVRASIMLPDQAANGAATLVEGIGQGLSGAPTVSTTAAVTYYTPPTNTSLVYYYNQPMYSTPPFDPGYSYEYWYAQPNGGIVFYAGGQHRRHEYNGNYNGQIFQHRGNYNRDGGRHYAYRRGDNSGKGDHHLNDRQRREARERAKRNRHD